MEWNSSLYMYVIFIDFEKAFDNVDTSEVLRYESCSYYTANTPYLPSPHKRSPDGATTD